MGAWLKQFWTDPAYFRTTVKTAVSFVGGLIASGIIPVEQWRYGFILMSIAHALPSGGGSDKPKEG